MHVPQITLGHKLQAVCRKLRHYTVAKMLYLRTRYRYHLHGKMRLLYNQCVRLRAIPSFDTGCFRMTTAHELLLLKENHVLIYMLVSIISESHSKNFIQFEPVVKYSSWNRAGSETDMFAS